MNAIGRFITDRCVIGPAVCATTNQLHEAFCTWQQQDGCEPIGRRTFGDALDKRGYPAEKPIHGKRWRRGIGLQVELADDDE